MPARPFFRPPVVYAATGLNQGTVSRWFGAGLLAYLDVAQAKTGVARLFSFEDVCTLALMKRLTDLGMSLKAANRVAQEAIDAVDLHPAEYHELIYLEYPGESRATITFNDQPIKPGAVLRLGIDLHILFDNVAARLRAAGGAVQPAETAGASRGS